MADAWGYDVEVAGLGRAQEKDEWGRDEKLGHASQVAVFRRKEGEDWAGVRRRKLETAEGCTRAKARSEHILIAAHRYEPHTTARRAGSLQEIGEVVRNRMARWGTRLVTLHELWFEHDISQLCGGWLSILIMAVDLHEELDWNIRGTKLFECDVEWKGFVEEKEVPHELPSTVADPAKEECPATPAVRDEGFESWGGSWSQIPVTADSWQTQRKWGENGESVWDLEPSLEGWGQVTVKS